MENSKIEWTDHTFNPWLGCTKVSAGCQHCYAETLMDGRFGRVQWGPQGARVRTSAANWRKPLAWNRQQWHQCRACGWRGRWEHTAGDESQVCCPICGKCNTAPTRQRVFCASLADVFERKADQPEMDEWRRDLFELTLATPNLDWLFLTKRPENVIGMSSLHVFAQGLPSNVWIGTSVENQEQADKRIPELLKINASVRFLSVEPLLGPIDLNKRECLIDKKRFTYTIGRYLDWVIVGGESGPDARPMHPQWARDIRDQCQAAGVPFLFKQWGEWIPSSHITNNMSDHGAWAWPWATGESGNLQGDTTMMVNVGKHAAGRLLDGREWSDYPPTAQE